ncbi:MAG: hypothetical protein FWD49_06795 [Firmicutes bacterium]|nr:hypothetical protein [Bacillota bacterium]
MIQIIYGSKGTGKTKIIIDRANAGITEHLGDIVFITDTSRYVHQLKYQIRFTNTKDSNIYSEDGLIGFIQGMTEANYDIRFMYIDGAARMVSKDINDMEAFYKRLEQIATKTEVTFILTVSCDFEFLPAFIKKYIK